MSSLSTSAAMSASSALHADRVEDIGPHARRWLSVGMLFAHVAAGWGLMQIEGVRQAVTETAPMMVSWIAPPEPLPPAPPPPPAKPRVAPPKPAPVIAAAPTPAPQPVPTFTAPAPPTVATPVTAPEAPPAPPAPPAPAPPAAPKLVPASALRYVTLPQQVYPLASRRLGEAGTVMVRVVVDVRGSPRQVSLHQSSGFARLDEQALTAMRAARFQPCTDNGHAIECMAIAPLAYELD